MINFCLPVAEYYEDGDPGLSQLVEDVRSQNCVALDTETTGLNISGDIVKFWSLAWEGRRIALHANTLRYFDDIFAQENRVWILTNAKFDMHMLENTGHHLGGEIIDIMVMHSLLYEDAPHSLDYMARQLLGWEWKGDFHAKFKELGPEKYLDWLYDTNRQSLIDYCANDTYGTFALFKILQEELLGTRIWSQYPDVYPTMWEYFRWIEVPFTRVLWKMERNGIRVDTEFLKQAAVHVDKDLQNLKRDLITKVRLLDNERANEGKPKVFGTRVFNPGSNADLQNLFINMLGLRPLSMTKGGVRSGPAPQVNEAFFQHYADSEPLAHMLLQIKELSKMYSTYLDKLPKCCDGNSRIHARFNQSVARTGRLSSSDPNLFQ